MMEGELIMIWYPMREVVAVMKSFPMIPKRPPIPPAMANLTAFLSIKKKASSEEVQKFLLVMATNVNAFLLMNFINYSNK